MIKFSQKLIEETIKCFKEENNLDISEETASEYLKYFAGLYLAFTDMGQPTSSEFLKKTDEVVPDLLITKFPSGASDI